MLRNITLEITNTLGAFSRHLGESKLENNSLLLKNDEFEIESLKSSSIDKELHEKFTKQCLEIANRAEFKTDFQDVYDHLFGGEYELAFVKQKGEIKGFAVFDLLDVKEKKVLHLHGIILHPEAQQYGNTKKLLQSKINETKANVLTLKTHNPRMYAAAASLGKCSKSTYPSFTGSIPAEIIDLCKNNHFISGCDESLVVRNAYPDVKIQQSISNESIRKGFKENVGKYDAQAVVVILD